MRIMEKLNFLKMLGLFMHFICLDLNLGNPPLNNPWNVFGTGLEGLDGPLLLGIALYAY